MQVKKTTGQSKQTFLDCLSTEAEFDDAQLQPGRKWLYRPIQIKTSQNTSTDRPRSQNWVLDREGIDHNVFIVGGEQTEATFAFALRRAGIGRVAVVDAAPDEGKAGIWLTRARMNRLRTPKGLPGPELDLPGLSFQSRYEARHGAETYAGFDRIARTDWANYLKWYRDFLGIGIRYGTRPLRVAY